MKHTPQRRDLGIWNDTKQDRCCDWGRRQTIQFTGRCGRPPRIQTTQHRLDTDILSYGSFEHKISFIEVIFVKSIYKSTTYFHVFFKISSLSERVIVKP
jgi:hypothetical protein